MERFLFFNAVETSPGVYDREYVESDFADYFGSVLSTGLLHTDHVPGVKAAVEPSTLNTILSPGRAILKGHLYENTTPKTLTHNIPEASLDRIDRIVLRLDLRNSGRNILSHVKEGTPAAAPVPPPLQRDQFVHEISLAQVRVRKNTVQLLPSDLVDERLDEQLCGLVHSLISIPTDQLQAFITAKRAELDSEMNARLDDYLSALTVAENNLVVSQNKWQTDWDEWFSGQQTEGFVLERYSVANREVNGLRVNDGKLEFYDGANWNIVEGRGIPVGNTVGMKVELRPALKIEISWGDPEDVTISDTTGAPVAFAKWKGTQLRRKIGSYPVNEKDGDLMTDNRTRDHYKTSPYIDQGLTEGTEYFYMLFPYTESGAVTVDASNRGKAIAANKLPVDAPSKPEVSGLKFDRATVNADSGAVVSLNQTDWHPVPHEFTGLTPEQPYTAYAKFPETPTHLESPVSSKAFTTPSAVKIYGVKIDTLNSNPETAVTYTDDAVGSTPMRLSGGSITMGSWADRYPFNEIAPVVVKNGVEQYELNPNDYTQKKAGGAADITSGAAGDVFVRFSKLWWKIETVGTDLYVRIATAPTPGYKKLAHTRAGADLEYAYIGAYLGYNDGGKLRSLSGKTVTASQTIGVFRTQGQAQGAGYTQFDYYKLLMVQVMLLIATKSRDSQAALGRGYVDGNASYATTGGTDKKGLNFGETTGKMQNKIFGIEDFWGNYYQWIDGLYCDASWNILIGDSGYNDTGASYTNHGKGASANLSGYISQVQGGTETGFIIKEGSGSETTHYADYGYLNSGSLPIFGGSRANAGDAGAFRLLVYGSSAGSSADAGGRACFAK